MLYATSHLAVVLGSGRTDPHPHGSAGPHGVPAPLCARRPAHLVPAGRQRRTEPGADQNVGWQDERVVRGEDVVKQFHVGRRGEVAALISRPHLPPEVFVVEGRAKLEQKTFTNRDLLAGMTLGAVKKVAFKSPDGTAIEGFRRPACRLSSRACATRPSSIFMAGRSRSTITPSASKRNSTPHRGTSSFIPTRAARRVMARPSALRYGRIGAAPTSKTSWRRWTTRSPAAGRTRNGLG